MYLARTYLLRTLFGSALGTEPTTSRSEVKRSIDSANPLRERKPMQLFSCHSLCSSKLPTWLQHYAENNLSRED